MKTIPHLILILPYLLLGMGCRYQSGKKGKNMEEYPKGTYGFDKQFLQNHHETIELKDGGSAIILVPDFQGRVMTSTCEGDSGFSFGWINYDLIEKEQPVEHFNPYGGEERFWLGPEGGQFSIYFEKGKEFVFENWYVPAPIDTEPFQLTDKSGDFAVFRKEMELVNYYGTPFDLRVTRKVSLLSPKQIKEFTGADNEEVSAVAYESANNVRNSGTEAWEKETGLLSIWMLGMFIPSPEVTVVIPVKAGDESRLGPKVNDDYFGRIGDDRLKAVGNTVFFKADGKSRGKIGIPPLRATRFMGSYDDRNGILTVLECLLPESETDYVNSAWEMQEEPYGGDALNSYNDGPLEDGTQMGPFYELEASSPALDLMPGQDYTHTQRIYHFMGTKEALDPIARRLLNVSIAEITEVF